MPRLQGIEIEKALCYRVISTLKQQYEVIILPELEADDAMGIYATANPGNIIVSPDKDMRQIPASCTTWMRS